MKRDPSPSTGTQIQKETYISTPSISPEVSDNIMDYNKITEAKKQVEQMPWQSHSGEPDAWSYSLSNQGFASMEDGVLASFSTEKEQAMAKDTMSSSFVNLLQRGMNKKGSLHHTGKWQRKKGRKNTRNITQVKNSKLRKIHPCQKEHISRRNLPGLKIIHWMS